MDQMSKARVLFISNGHPALFLGGTELYALDAYEAFRASDEFEPVFIARAGPPYSRNDAPHPDTPLTMVTGTDSDQYLLYTDASDYDYLFGTACKKASLSRTFEDFLHAQSPDVIHFQHSHLLGYDMLRVARNALPDAPIVYSLHEYVAICHREGQMVRTKS